MWRGYDHNGECLDCDEPIGAPHKQECPFWNRVPFWMQNAKSSEEIKDLPEPSITCPKCGMKSYNVNDIKHRYCGNCHEYHDAMQLIPVEGERMEKKDLPIPVPGSEGSTVGHMLSPNTENCPKCGATPDTFYVANHSLMWHDGDVMCRCGHRVRSYDAG